MRIPAGKEPCTLIFIHIPKTGGSTLKALLLRQYASQQRFVRPPGDAAEHTRELASLPLAAKREIKLVYIQHAAFGVHQALPQPSSYATLLREPWNRMVSDYSHAARNPTHSFYTRIQEGAAISDFVAYRAEVQGLTNPVTRLISGENPYAPFHRLGSYAFEVACRHIDEFFGVAGLTERFDESLLLMKRFFGWSSVLYTPRNVGKSDKGASLTREVRDAFRQANELDYALYDHVASKLDERIRDEGQSFQAEVRRFRMLNSAYRMVYGWLLLRAKALRPS